MIIKVFKKYLKIFKNIRSANSYKYYYYKDQYYSSIQIIAFQKILSYMMKEDSSYFKTSTRIKFKNIAFTSSINETIEILGKPNHLLDHTFNGVGYKTLHYKCKLGSYKAYLTLYFTNNSFFCGQYIFKNRTSDIDIENTLVLKYLTSEHKDLLNYPIIDQEENILVFKSDIVTIVTYISGSSRDRNYILDKQNTFNQKLQEQKQENLEILNHAL